VQVQGVSPAVTQSPGNLNMSTGDTNRFITVSVTPSTISFSPTFSWGLVSDPNSSCDANLSFSGSGTGSVNSTISAGQAGCSGVFNAVAYDGPYGSNSSTQIVVPPQILIQMLYGEAHAQAASGDNVSQLAVGVAAQNRFSQAGFGGSTWQAIINATQFQGLATGITNGPSPDLDNAAAVFTSSSGVGVASAACFFSPDASGWTAIRSALQSGTTQVPRVNYDPGCYSANKQLVYKQSVGLNVNGSGAPAFIFEQYRANPGSDPAVVQIP
jgi:hypothetical protein